MPASEGLTQRQIARFWAPLAATWLMMAVEGPFLAAVIARLGEATFNLAAFGVAFSFAMLIEAPIIMMMSAAVALVGDSQSFLLLRRFTYLLNAAITLVMLVLLAPPVFRFVVERLVGLPHEVARLTHVATAILLPWPAAIGFRRFYQGVLIRAHLTRRVAYGTVVRVSSMALAAVALSQLTALPGAYVGAAALAAGVTAEAGASRWMARGAVRAVRAVPAVGAPLTTAAIVRFYVPLALTSVLTLGVNPVVTFLLGHSRSALDSLAVWPVVTALVFAFRSAGFAFQEVGVALLGDERRVRALARFAATLAAVTAGALVVVAFSPLARVWLATVSGLPPELTRSGLWPLRILCLMPALEVLLSFQRSRLVHARRTAPISWATAIEVGGLVAVTATGIAAFDLVGAVAGAAGMLTGRVAANTFLARATARLRPA